MLITKIEVQKKNRKRYSLYSEDIFLFGVSEDTLIHFQISKGSEFSDTKLLEIQNHEGKVQCLSQAYRFLSRRPHLTAELIRKLRLKKYEPSMIQNIIQILKEKKYLDDREYIQLFVSDQIGLKRSGPMLIKKKLLEKGADTESVNAVLAAAYPEDKQLINAQAHIEKKQHSTSGADTQKLYRFLQQKGFPWDIIRQLKFEGNQDS